MTHRLFDEFSPRPVSENASLYESVYFIRERLWQFYSYVSVSHPYHHPGCGRNLFIKALTELKMVVSMRMVSFFVCPNCKQLWYVRWEGEEPEVEGNCRNCGAGISTSERISRVNLDAVDSIDAAAKEALETFQGDAILPAKNLWGD